MTKMIPSFALALCTSTVVAETPIQAVRQAHDTYLAAINTNDIDLFMNAVTEDIVFIAPNTPVMEGKAQVEPWVEGYFGAVNTSWKKRSVELVVSGDWAFERYSYHVTDTPKGGGAPYSDTGNGINIYKLDHDGIWRVARDAWATSGPLVAAVEFSSGYPICELSGSALC